MRTAITSVNAEHLRMLMCLGHGHIQDLTWSPDGKTIALGTSSGVWLYAADNLQAMPRFLAGHTDDVNSVAFSRDGLLLASASRDNTARLWDAKNGSCIALLEGHTDKVEGVAFSPDGTQLATASVDNTLRLWDARTGQGLAVLSDGNQPDPSNRERSMYRVVFSPDGRLLASTGWSNTLRLWDAKTGQNIAVLKDHTTYVNDVAFSADGRWLASASFDCTVRLWDTDSWRSDIIELQTKPAVHVAFSPRGAMLASSILL